MINSALGDLTGLKFAIYLRRSEGEKGSTKAQLTRIRPMFKEIEQATGIPIDTRIVGKDIDKKERFNAVRDLAKPGDIWNEGEGASGFKIKNRPVFQELLKRMEKGDYDGVIVESFDRISRDLNQLSHYALPLWREDNKLFIGLNGEYLNDDLANEFLLGVKSNASSLTKAEEIKKSSKGRADALDVGFIKAGRPEFEGSGTKNAGLDYREAYKMMKEQGENKNGNLNNPSKVGKAFGKDNKWASSWYLKMRDYEKLGVLEDWLVSIERFNELIKRIAPEQTIGHSTEMRD